MNRKKKKKILKNNVVRVPLKIDNKLFSRFIRRDPYVHITGMRGLNLIKNFSGEHGSKRKGDKVNVSRIYSDETKGTTDVLHLYDAKNGEMLRVLQRQIDTSKVFLFYRNRKFMNIDIDRDQSYNDRSSSEEKGQFLVYHFNAHNNTGFTSAHPECHPCEIWDTNLESRPGFYILYMTDLENPYDPARYLSSNYAIGDVRYLYICEDQSDPSLINDRVHLIKRSSTTETYDPQDSPFSCFYYNVNYNGGFPVKRKRNSSQRFPTLADLADDLKTEYTKEGETGYIVKDYVVGGIYIPFEALTSQIFHANLPLEEIRDIQDKIVFEGILGDFMQHNKESYYAVKGADYSRYWPRAWISPNTGATMHYVETIHKHGAIVHTSIYVILPGTNSQLINRITENMNSQSVQLIPPDNSSYAEIKNAITTGSDIISVANRSSFIALLEGNTLCYSDKSSLDAIIVMIADSSDSPIYYIGELGNASDRYWGKPFDVLTQLLVPYNQNNSFGYANEC